MYTVSIATCLIVCLGVIAAEDVGNTAASAETVSEIPVVPPADEGEKRPVVDKPDEAGITTDEYQFVAEANTSIVLTCPLEGDVTWNKTGGITIDNKIHIVFPENNSLLIIKVGPDCSGCYNCSNATHTQSIILGVPPYVYQSDKKSKNVIEDDPFVMECRAWGFPEVQLTWKHGEELIVADDRIVFKDGFSSNSTLRITKTVFDDKGIYTCTAQNMHGNGTVVLEMNVKDKLAALWPFLGICAEVIILSTIIFIYEKRRTKRLEAEERKEEAEHLNAVNQAKEPEEVRHRKN